MKPRWNTSKHDQKVKSRKAQEKADAAAKEVAAVKARIETRYREFKFKRNHIKTVKEYYALVEQLKKDLKRDCAGCKKLKPWLKATIHMLDDSKVVALRQSREAGKTIDEILKHGEASAGLN